ncbi:MAG TPA: hypothetical protein VHG51_17700 [Longimicrobiaceae bacterium]|nr:hypothetical protein [Longimicrobiaceae bacterium]
MNVPTSAAVSLAFALAAAPTVLAAQEHTAPRSAVVDARGASLVRVDARAGSLRVEGRPGLTEVRVRGTARANRERDLEGIRLIAERRGDQVHVEVVMPRETVLLGSIRRVLDLVVEVPEGIAADVDDSSGEAVIRRVGNLRVEDSSGELEIEDVRGDVRVTDSSGALSIVRVAGDVWVSDGSGELRVHDVRGGVTVDEDGSGEMDIRDVAGDVLVREDGSGGIRVDRVGGNLTVQDDGSGGVRVARVAGTVRLPRS